MNSNNIKYSFIVPVYNTEKYLKKCLDSLVNQTYKDFEIIIVNDGSTDNSINIINEYSKKYKNIKVINQKNGGLSHARNEGVKNANGKYILFVDSDDYVETELLNEVEQKIDGLDLLRFQVVIEDEEYNNIKTYEEKEFSSLNGYEAIKIISNYFFVEPACFYVYNKDFYLKNKFKFTKNVYHEDFGLIPYVIYKANKVSSINYIGYHYIQRSGSIMNNEDYNKTLKKAYDMLELYKDLRAKRINNSKENKDDYFLSYISNCTIVKAKSLNKKDQKDYLNELKKINVYDDVLINTISRKIKKIIMKISLNLYLKVAK